MELGLTLFLSAVFPLSNYYVQLNPFQHIFLDLASQAEANKTGK